MKEPVMLFGHLMEHIKASAVSRALLRKKQYHSAKDLQQKLQNVSSLCLEHRFGSTGNVFVIKPWQFNTAEESTEGSIAVW